MAFAPLNWRLASAELDGIVGLLDPQIMFYDAATAPLWHGSEVAENKAIRSIALHEEYQEFVATGDARDRELTICGCDTAVQLYTSGTTGVPKGSS